MSTFDPKRGEKEYFARIGEEGRRHAAKKPFGDENCVQYLMNMATIMSLFDPPPGRVLEFGCGTGWLSLIFAERGYEVLGVDISQDAIAIARELKEVRGISTATFVAGDYEEIPVLGDVDYVIFHDALHHAESELAALTTAFKALRKGGMVVCIEPGLGHSQSDVSKAAVQNYGVHEKDMPPGHIIRTAKAAGFHRHVVLPWPWYHLRSIYRPAYRKSGSDWDLRGRKLLSIFRLLKSVFRTREQGLVVLFKD